MALVQELFHVRMHSFVLCLISMMTLSNLWHCSLAFDPDSTNLTFMLITSFGQFGFNSSGGLPAAEMALEDINNTPDVLPGYNLVYDSIRDSQVSYAVYAIFMHTYHAYALL